METISREELEDLIAENSDFILVNVLGRDSFEKVHIPGSISIPFNSGDFESAIIDRIPRQDTRIVVYCASPD